MNDLIHTLHEHAERYPAMTPQDALKLLYQRTFGCGHFVTDIATSLTRLEDEYAAVSPSNLSYEYLGNGWGRIYLGGFSSTDLPLEILNRMFCLSSQSPCGDLETFEIALSILEIECTKGTLPFSAEELRTYLTSYRASGCPAVSHSEAYRSAYHPAYRVVREEYIRALPIICAIADLARRKNHVILAIDGPAAAGKSTLAQLLATLYEAPVIHMDDFFLPPTLRTSERLAKPGGNLHRERFLEEVIPSLRQNLSFSYGLYNCSQQRIDGAQQIPAAPLHIVEGSYSHHPDWQNIYDLRIFLQVDPADQERRIRQRNGEEMWKRFRDLWIPMEHNYFETFDIMRKSHIFLKI